MQLARVVYVLYSSMPITRFNIVLVISWNQLIEFDGRGKRSVCCKWRGINKSSGRMGKEGAELDLGTVHARNSSARQGHPADTVDVPRILLRSCTYHAPSQLPKPNSKIARNNRGLRLHYLLIRSSNHLCEEEGTNESYVRFEMMD
jgi:hypothetical protein